MRQLFARIHQSILVWLLKRTFIAWALIFAVFGASCDGCMEDNYREHWQDRDAGHSRDQQKYCTDGARAVLDSCRNSCDPATAIFGGGSRSLKECNEVCDEQYAERKRECKRY